ncbi:MAG: AAA family ATPase, partial [Bacillota bacterium]|nr:AAA family ATPase [Bacillota bacterium]
MYISELILEGFRGFKNEQIIEFHEGINVIIGHNNSGKTTVIKALELLFGEKSNKQLSIDDFNKKVKIDELKEKPPYITISAKLKESNDEDEYSDDLVTVSTWLTKINKPYEALITYKFFLPDKELDDYIKAMNNIDSIDIQDYWYEIEYNFLRKYTYKVYVGNPEHQNVLESETIKKFDFQFLS